MCVDPRRQNSACSHHAGDTKSADTWRRRMERPTLQVMMQSLPALCAELRRCYSDLGRLPVRSEMRAAGRCASLPCGRLVCNAKDSLRVHFCYLVAVHQLARVTRTYCSNVRTVSAGFVPSPSSKLGCIPGYSHVTMLVSPDLQLTNAVLVLQAECIHVSSSRPGPIIG